MCSDSTLVSFNKYALLTVLSLDTCRTQSPHFAELTWASHVKITHEIRYYTCEGGHMLSD